jgi:hypothetical protein
LLIALRSALNRRYFSGLGEIGANIPPQQRESARDNQPLLELGDYIPFGVSLHKASSKRKPLRARNSVHLVE